MKHKRMVNLMLALALLLSLLSPAASAAGQEGWDFHPLDTNPELPLNHLQDNIAELRQAAAHFAPDETVAAFVVMDQEPLSESYHARSRVLPAAERKLLATQNRIIGQIRNRICADAELKVRYQFTYLTNSFTVETAFGNLEKIAGLEGVRSVFVMPVYRPCDTAPAADPRTAVSADLTGVRTVWQELGYTGAGMKIAVIDTGLDLDHPSFRADPLLTETSMTPEDIGTVLPELNAYARTGWLTAEALYRSAKIPFAFNYCDSNLNADHSSDFQGDHGTHVAGIAAANITDGTSVCGMAPDAQIIVMKVFGANGGAYTDDIVAALEDAMKLGCDVVNGSLGSPTGFSSTDTEIDRIFERLDNQDIVACFSAGNEGTGAQDNPWRTEANRTQNPDNGTLEQPGTYCNLLTVASAETGTGTEAEIPWPSIQMSDFSAWGVTPDLLLEPDITGIGGNVCSTLDGGSYGSMSGTSMASPQVAGITALVMQHLYARFPEEAPGRIRNMAQALLMSTADPIVYCPENEEPYGTLVSPRQQGAGLVNAYQAITAPAYLTVHGQEPKVSMGDSTTGEYHFAFEINNFSTEVQTYSLEAVLQTEEVSTLALTETEEAYFMAGTDWFLEGTVSFDRDTVTVQPGEQAEVKVTIRLSEQDQDDFRTFWKNGGYVEGFVFLRDVAGSKSLSLPFLGFYGDWTAAPLFDSGFWYDTSFWVEPYEGIPTCDAYWHIPWSAMYGVDSLPGFNPYGDFVTDEGGEVIFDPARAVLSPNGDDRMDGLTDLYLSLLRGARSMTISYYADGLLMKQETIPQNPRTIYQSAYGEIVPWMYSWYGTEGLYDFTDADGNPLPSGTEVKIRAEAAVDYGHGGDHSVELTLYVDTLPPELVQLHESVGAQGERYLTVETRDDIALAAVFLMNASGTQIYGTVYDHEMEVTESGTWLARFDVSGKGTEFQIVLGDYGANESSFSAVYSSPDGNLPTPEGDLLYAYRLSDDGIPGWVSVNPPTEDASGAHITTWTEESQEQSAILAAEYAAGRIFAIDSLGNLLTLTPGLFERTTICSLAIDGLDMTFDDSTDTMYVLGMANGGTVLYGLDPVTCELTELACYGDSDSGPAAIADDDNGTLYAVGLSIPNLFTLDPADGYAMKPVTAVVNGTVQEVLITDSRGEPVNPWGSQSLTFEDGILYWACCSGDWLGESSELITVNTEDWSFFSKPYVSTWYDPDGCWMEEYPVTCLAGLMTLRETEYTLPLEGIQTGLTLDKSRLALQAGQSARLCPLPVPWYYELEQVTWSSSDATVATVDEQGTVTAHTPGTAVITAKHTHSGVTSTASCRIKVLGEEDVFLSWNITEGCWSSISRMDYGIVTNLTEPAGEWDVIALASDGVDVYGYDQNNQLFRLDPDTFRRTPIGNGPGAAEQPGQRLLIQDMAYDQTGGRMLVLGQLQQWNEITEEYESSWGSCGIYRADLTTGELIKVTGIDQLDDLNALAVDDSGYVYVYCLSDDHVYQVDPDTGLPITVASLQNHNLCGAWGCHYSMAFDEAADTLYLLFSADGMTQQIHAINPGTGEVQTGTAVGSLLTDEWGCWGENEFAGLTVLESSGNSEPAQNPFTDVSDADYFYDCVLWALEHQITQGIGNGLFGPGRGCTRAQVVTFLWRAMGEPEPVRQENPFTDVPENAYYHQAVLWAAQNGITSGVAPDRFAPESVCTRAQVVTFLWRTAGAPAPVQEDTPFADVPPDAYYHSPVLWAVERKITSGTGANTFSPDSACTRAQIVTFLYRLWEE